MIKLSKGCTDCGYAAHAVALQFDHVGDDKKMNVSDMIRSDYAWETIKIEIDKCEVRCANCHAVVTQERKRASSNHQSCETMLRFLAGELRFADEADLSPDAFSDYPQSTDLSWLEP